MTNVKYWHFESELRQYIDKATRWKIDVVYNGRTEKNPYHIFRHFIENSDTNFDTFSLQLREVLSKTEHWKAIEIDLKNRFLPMINRYIEWYNTHEPELQKFEPYNPYSLMLDVIEQTKKEILKYFPEPIPKPEKQKGKNLTLNEIALKYRYEGKQVTRENSNDIAQKYGHNSGEKLFQLYTFFGSRANRTGKPTPCTPKKLKNKIELFQKVIIMLPESKRQQAIDEVTILENIYNSEFL